MTKLAFLIAKEEGFFVSGSLPQRNNNPGDLRHSNHSEHSPDAPNAIGDIDTVADGWADLERQLQIDASRGMTLQGAIYSWAPPSENDTAKYLADVLAGFAGEVSADTPLTDVLEIQA
jgi:hypothetical protein